jgi:hypothetical protein
MVNSIPLKKDSPHYSFKTDILDMLDFNGGANVLPLSLPVAKTVVFEPNLSVFKSRTSLKGYVRAVVPEYGDFSDLKLHIFENNIKKLIEDVDLQESIETTIQEVAIGSGKVFVVSDPESLKNFDTLSKIPTYLFECVNKNNTDCIVVSPNALPADVESVVYLDKPMQPISFEGKIYSVSNEISYKILDEVSIDRSVFADIFAILKNNCNKRFNSATEFFYKNVNDGNGFNFVFATTVFMELGIFKVVNDVLQYDIKVKNPLTNSKVYSKICMLKG